MEFKFDGGKYVWDQKAINTQFRPSADTYDNKLLWQGPLRIQTLGVGGSAFFNGKVPEDVRSWSQQGPVTLPVSFLSVYQAASPPPSRHEAAPRARSSLSKQA